MLLRSGAPARLLKEGLYAVCDEHNRDVRVGFWKTPQERKTCGTPTNAYLSTFGGKSCALVFNKMRQAFRANSFPEGVLCWLSFGKYWIMKENDCDVYTSRHCLAWKINFYLYDEQTSSRSKKMLLMNHWMITKTLISLAMNMVMKSGSIPPHLQVNPLLLLTKMRKVAHLYR